MQRTEKVRVFLVPTFRRVNDGPKVGRPNASGGSTIARASWLSMPSGARPAPPRPREALRQSPARLPQPRGRRANKRMPPPTACAEETPEPRQEGPAPVAPRTQARDARDRWLPPVGRSGGAPRRDGERDRLRRSPPAR